MSVTSWPPGLLLMTPLIRVLLADFCERKVGHMVDEWDQRQADLYNDPADPRTLAQCAQQLHTAERTLACATAAYQGAGLA